MLNRIQLRKIVTDWLDEDSVHGLDYAGEAIDSSEDDQASCVLLSKSDGQLAGCPFFKEIFRQLHCHVDWILPNDVSDDIRKRGDGWTVTAGQRVALVTGHPRDLLLGERTALNCLCRASGIATQARRIRELVKREATSWGGVLAGTRKTTPGFRLAEKYALLIGGVDPHRYDLTSMVMLKDNHVWAAGSVAKAISNCRRTCSFSLKIEVECRSLQEAREAAKAKCDIVMLDNFSPDAAKSVSEALKEEFPSLLIEVSGGIDEHNVLQFTHPTVDIISMSQFTQGYPVLNFSLKILKEGHDPNNPTVVNA